MRLGLYLKMRSQAVSVLQFKSRIGIHPAGTCTDGVCLPENAECKMKYSMGIYWFSANYNNYYRI